MKKVVCIAIIIAFVLTMTACGAKETGAAKKQAGSGGFKNATSDYICLDGVDIEYNVGEGQYYVVATARNCSNRQMKHVWCDFDILNEDGVIVDQIYACYDGLLDVGQACYVRAVVEDLPTRIRIASGHVIFRDEVGTTDFYLDTPYTFMATKN